MRAQAGASGEGRLQKKRKLGFFVLTVCVHRGGLRVVDLISSAGDSEPKQLCSMK